MGDNAAQIADWNGAVGRRWASLQSDLDVMVRPFGDAALSAAALKAGERVLDVGCGCGDTTFEIARRIGPTGTVLGVDVSQPMLEVARQRGKADGMKVEFQEADASKAPLPRDRDLIFSRFGVMFFDAPVQAFAHLRQSLAKGGRLTFCCWQELKANPWADVPLQAVRKALEISLPPTDPQAPGPFAFAAPERVEAILREAGFSEIRVQPFEASVHWGNSPEAAAASAIRVGPVARLIRDQGEAAQPIALKAIEREMMLASGLGRGIGMKGAAWIVSASYGL